MDAAPPGHQSVVDLYLAWPDAPQSPEEATARLCELLASVPFATGVRRVAIAVCPGGDREVSYFSFRPGPDGIVEDDLVRGVHPMVGRRLNLWRLRNFRITRLDAPRTCCSTTASPTTTTADQRLVALAQIRQFAIVRDQDGQVVSLPHAERAVASCLEAIRRARTSPDMNGAQLDMNHVWLHIWPVVDAQLDELSALQRTIAPLTVGAGIEEVLAQGRISGPDGVPHPVAVRFSYQPGSGVVASVINAPTERLQPLDDYAQKVLRARRRGTVYPYEITRLLAGDGAFFVERRPGRDRRAGPGRPRARAQHLRPRRRPRTTVTERHPEGITRVVLLGDPTKAWARWPSPSAPGSSRPWTWPSRCRCRWSGSRSRPAPGSRWTPARRTWTGWRGP